MFRNSGVDERTSGGSTEDSSRSARNQSCHRQSASCKQKQRALGQINSQTKSDFKDAKVIADLICNGI